MKIDITKSHFAYYVIGGTLHSYRVTGIQPPNLNDKKCRLYLDSYTIQFTHVKGAMFEGSAKRTDGKPFYVFVNNAKLAWEQYKKELLAERGIIIGGFAKTKLELGKIDEKIKQVNARLK